MKRKIASRKLQRRCTTCNCRFVKGNVYYVQRYVYVDYERFDKEMDVIACEFIYCPKCKYKRENQKRRYEHFKDKCQHNLTNEVWSYIPGEAVMQPDHTECRLCGAYL